MSPTQFDFQKPFETFSLRQKQEVNSQQSLDEEVVSRSYFDIIVLIAGSRGLAAPGRSGADPGSPAFTSLRAAAREEAEDEGSHDGSAD
jgi:hypothetical protein